MNQTFYPHVGISHSGVPDIGSSFHGVASTLKKDGGDPFLIEIVIRPERQMDEAAIEALGIEAFGPGRFSRSAFRLREKVKADPRFCFVAECQGVVVGSVRLTRILIGGRDALVLGPLMIDPSNRSLGIGRELMNRSMHEAQKMGYELVVLVGDHAYYRKFGFEKVPAGQITFPGPADPARILACELKKGVLANFVGETKRYFG